MRRPPLVLLIALILAPSPALVRADVLHLTDGTTLEGDVKKARDGWVVTDATGKVTNVPASKVQSIEIKGGGAAAAKANPDAAEQKLYSLRRSVENVNDVGEIVNRYKRFVEQNKGTEVARAAEAELAVWVDRQSRGLVKVGGQWVTPDERTALLEQTVAVVSEARQLIKDGRFKEADALLGKAMQVDPTNPSVQYLRGVLKYKLNDMPGARKAFELVAEQIPTHGPTLNNIAVILARQNQEAASLGMFDRAMQAEPNSRVILDNFAEGFNAMTNDQRKVPIVQKALKRFLEQDERLRAEMEPKGLYRWGSTWVNQQQKEANEAAEAKIKTQLDELAAEFDAAQMRIKTIDEDIEQNNRTLRSLDSRRYGRNSSGQIVQAQPTQRMYDIQADNQQLAAERAQHVAKLKQLRAAARDVEKQLPTPRFTGEQKMIETEGTPIRLADGTTTRPVEAEGTAELPATPATPATTAPSAPATEPAQ
jgi:tetratricopeptide (TPR) repeat protein